MLNDKQKARIKQIWNAVDGTHEAEAFWQDHFYSSGGKFGFPVCVQLTNTVTKQIEDSAIIGWHTWQSGGEIMLQQIEDYLIEIGAIKRSSEPDNDASAAPVGYDGIVPSENAPESGVRE